MSKHLESNVKVVKGIIPNDFNNNTDSSEWLFKVVLSGTTSPLTSAAGLFVAFAAFIQNETGNVATTPAAKEPLATGLVRRSFRPIFLILCMAGIVLTEIARFELLDDLTIAAVKQNVNAAASVGINQIRSALESSFETWRTNYIVYTAMLLGMKS